MFSDRHFPPSFLAGNKSIRDMLKDPEEYDRRMTNLNKRKEELQKERDKRDSNVKYEYRTSILRNIFTTIE